MRTSIDYRFVSQNSEDFRRLQTFAESFDHCITPSPHINVYAHFKGDTLVGYSDHVYLPIVYPAFHPNLTTPRDVVQVMSDWRAHCQLSGKPSAIGVPLDNRNGAGNFPESTMNKLGLVRMHREVYLPQ